MPNAYWLGREAIAWLPDDFDDSVSAALHYDSAARMYAGAEGVENGERIDLVRAPELPSPLRSRFPHLAGLPVWTAFLRSDVAREIVRGEIALAAYRDGRLIELASVQLPGVIDELFVYDGPLGPAFAGDSITLRLWAPTARNVTLQLDTHSDSLEAKERRPMERDPLTGVWRVSLPPEMVGRFYRYELEVYVITTGRFERNVVTDPYSLALGTSSRWSQLADLDAPGWKPAGWDSTFKPKLDRVEDAVVYELHVRDFSATDDSVPEVLRGRYGAFAAESNGTRHLRRLAAAGVTHVQLLPVNDFATADDESRAYNWGYDPLHWLTPEGSYAAEPDGAHRTLELREAILALGRLGLRVVLDVVFNHTYAAGQSPFAIVDRIVPGYYHRLDEDGNVATSTCCSNTASEHRMMEKIIVDAVVLWATKYKVDGFRFDLMGHHMKSTMLRVRDTLRALTPERDGVDGSTILLFGEGWDFGEVAHNARGENASQLNLAGSGIGTFNDRMRDGIRGGNPFGEPFVPGFATGLSDLWQEGPTRLRNEERRIESGLAGNLRDAVLIDDDGNERRAFDLGHIGLAAAPCETVNYAAAHDNETLFDTINLKAPSHWSAEVRVRMNNIAISLIALAQGIPFFHAGDELLRSKGGDRNSYLAGDVVNAIDFSLATNHWGTFLPSKRENAEVRERVALLFRNPNTFVTPAEIARAVDHFTEMLRIRRSAPLLRLGDAARLLRAIRFHDRSALGVVVMTLAEDSDSLLAIFNARPEAYRFAHDGESGMSLHAVLRESTDAVVREASFVDGVASVPPRTTAVFVR